MYDAHHAIETAFADLCGSYEALRPPRRVPVSQGAADTLVIKRPGDAAMKWSPERTPYLIEPMDMLASRLHEAVIFAAPAQCGKTVSLGEGWLSHNVVNDPGDMLIVQMTEAKAREYSKQRIDRALKNSPRLEALRGPSSTDNLHDKHFRHGMMLKIAWPTATNLSSTSYRYVFITDFDRMPEDIDGEGDAFALGRTRTRTFRSRGMTCVESSPGYPLVDPSWRPATPHEAPPVKGVLGYYNQTDRRRWYWKCPHCSDWFEAAPGLSLFKLIPPEDQVLEMVREADLGALAKDWAKVICPTGCVIEFKDRYGLNQRGRWLSDGQRLTADDEVVGTAMTSSMVGYWLGGVAACDQTWVGLVTKYLQGLRDYALTGSELALQTTTNVDQGVPYISRHLLEATRGRARPHDRAEKELKQYIVPDATRTIVAAVDVQGGSTARFEVQVHAVGENMEQWLIDRYKITKSQRPGVGEEFAPIDPASYQEDWDVLTDRVVNSTYRTSVEGREMRVKLVVVDTGGEHRKKGVGEAKAEGVSEKAYTWFRKLRRLGLAGRVMLYKGNNTKTDWKVKETMVGRRSTNEAGDVPLWLCNPNLISDEVSTGLKRQFPGPGYIHFPTWLPQAAFDELEAEVRNEDGTWMKIRARNETFDLCRMIRAGCLRLGLDKVRDWAAVPDWLKPVAHNSEVVSKDERRAMQEQTAQVQRRPLYSRRRGVSSYLGG